LYGLLGDILIWVRRLQEAMSKTQKKLGTPKGSKKTPRAEKSLGRGGAAVREERDRQIDLATKLVIELHREALKELERY
jgi:hypothetical protein